MLSDADWADRMAIPVTFIQAVGRPTAAALMQSFTTWRWGNLNRSAWSQAVVKGMTSNRPTRVNDPAAHNRMLFYNALYQKRVNLYGESTGDNADRLALVRHPWTLTADEFYNCLEALLEHKLPGTDIISDQSKWSNTVVLVAAVPGLAGIAIGATIFPVTGSVIAGIGALVAAIGALEDRATANQEERQDKQIRSHLKQYVTIYEREAAYRRRDATLA